MRALLIDPIARTVTELERERWDLPAIYQALSPTDGFSVDTVDSFLIAARSLCWLDDRGHERNGNPVWRWSGYAHPLAGRGLVLGCHEEGVTVSTQLVTAVARQKVGWTDELAGGVGWVETESGIRLFATPKRVA